MFFKNISTLNTYLSGILSLHSFIFSSNFLKWFLLTVLLLKNIRHIFLTIMLPSQTLVLSRIFLLFSGPISSFPMIIYYREHRSKDFSCQLPFLLPIIFTVLRFISLQGVYLFGTRLFFSNKNINPSSYFHLHSVSCRVFSLSENFTTRIYFIASISRI